MIELIQVPYSPFCIVQRRILEYSGVPFKITNIPNSDRSLVWKLSRGRYYAVPIVRDGRTIVFETDEDSQVVAKYLDNVLSLSLFPEELRGVQSILWRFIESEVEGLTFKLNDIYWQENVPAAERLGFVRHKERKFGRGCLKKWKAEQKDLVRQLTDRLVPFEQMLVTRDFLLDARARFVDFDLHGMLANFLYSGHYQLPRRHNLLRGWFNRMSLLKSENHTREKLRT